jgi:hypothetical protein
VQTAPPPVIDTLAELETITAATEPVYVRYSKGPRHDAREQSTDTESGLELPVRRHQDLVRSCLPDGQEVEGEWVLQSVLAFRANLPDLLPILRLQADAHSLAASRSRTS